MERGLFGATQRTGSTQHPTHSQSTRMSGAPAVWLCLRKPGPPLPVNMVIWLGEDNSRNSRFFVPPRQVRRCRTGHSPSTVGHRSGARKIENDLTGKTVDEASWEAQPPAEREEANRATSGRGLRADRPGSLG